MNLTPKTIDRRTVSHDSNEVVVYFDLPAGGRVYNMDMDWRIIGEPNVHWKALTGYGIQGWVMPVPDATHSHDYDELYDNWIPADVWLEDNGYSMAQELMVVEDDNYSEEDEDLGPTTNDDSSMYHDKSQVEFATMDWMQFFPDVLPASPAQIFKRERIFSAGMSNTFTEAGGQYQPIGHFRTKLFNGKRGFTVNKPSVVMFSFSSPEWNINVHTTKPKTLEDIGWLRYQYITDTLDQALMHWMGDDGNDPDDRRHDAPDGSASGDDDNDVSGVDTGTYTVQDNTFIFDAAAAFLLKFFNRGVVADVDQGDHFSQIDWEVCAITRWGITVPGRHVISNITT